METIKEMEKRHQEEFVELQKNCPHDEAEIIKGYNMNEYHDEITIKCIKCGTPIFGWCRRVNFCHGFKNIVPNAIDKLLNR